MNSWPREPEVTEQADYERIGLGYAAKREPDPRIAGRIWTALGSARTLINVGAGTGSYEPVDRVVFPVEPSATMRRQRPFEAPPALNATAESLPFDDGSFDAAMAIMTVHHWSDLDRGLRELRRVSRGPVVVMTFDPDALACFWLARYAPELYQVEQARFPTVERIRQLLGGKSTVSAVPIPLDCTDGFAEAFYGRPEALLDPNVRRAQSGWAFRGAGEASAVERLRQDLGDGSWDRKYGHLRTQPEFVGAIRIVTAAPANGSVVAALLVRESRVLLCLRRSDRPWYPGVWDLPGGHVEPAETVQRALARELLEELGLTIWPSGARDEVDLPEGRLSIFTLYAWEGEPANAAPDEHEAIGWFTMDEVDQLPLADGRLADLIRRRLAEPH